MTRVTRGFVAKKRRKKVLKLASGFTGANHRLFRTAQQRVLRALSLAYRDRRLYKRKIRGVWIRRMNSFLRGYSCLGRAASHVHGLEPCSNTSEAMTSGAHEVTKVARVELGGTPYSRIEFPFGETEPATMNRLTRLRPRPLNYSIFVGKLKKFNILLNRKILSQLSIFDPLSMEQIVHHVL
jgi:ribosomal protein L20